MASPSRGLAQLPMDHNELWSLATRARASRRLSRAALRGALCAPDAATQLAAAALATRPEVEAPLEIVATLTRRALHAARHDLPAAAEALVRGSRLPLAQRLVAVLPQQLDPPTAAAIAATVAKVHNGQILPALPPHPHDAAWAVLTGIESVDAVRRTQLAIKGNTPPRATEILLAALVPADSLPRGVASDLADIIWERRKELELIRFARSLGCAYGLLAHRCGVENIALRKFTEFDSFAIASLLPIVGHDSERALLAIEMANTYLPRELRFEFARKSGSARLMLRAAQLLRDESTTDAKATAVCLAIADALPHEKEALESTEWSSFAKVMGTIENGDDAVLLASAAFVRYATFASDEARHEVSRHIARKLAQRFSNSPPIHAAVAVIDAAAYGGDAVSTARALAQRKSSIVFTLLMRLAVRCNIDVLNDVLLVAKSIVDVKDSHAAVTAVLGADGKRKDILVSWFLSLDKSRRAKL